MFRYAPRSLPHPPSDDVEAGGPGAGATAESRAARAYEARINPFAEFQQTEQEMRVRNMQVGRAWHGGARVTWQRRARQWQSWKLGAGGRPFLGLYSGISQVYIELGLIGPASAFRLALRL